MTTMTRPKVRTSRVVRHLVEFDPGDDQEPIEFDVQHSPADWLSDSPIVKRRADGIYVVGYLAHDDDAQNPLEDCDGMGKVFSAHRHAGREVHEGFREALGLDSDWRRTRRPNPLAVSLDCYDHGGQVWAISGSLEAARFPDQQWDVAHGGGVWVPDDSCEETIWFNALKSFLPEEMVDVSYHSEEPYGKDGQGYLNRILVRIKVGPALQAVQNWKSRTRGTKLPDYVTLRPQGYKSFRSAVESALRFFGIRPDRAEILRRVRGEAVKMAKGVVEEYNKWLSGDCWGVCLETYTAEGDLVEEDACWSFIGEEYAMQELNDGVNRLMKEGEQHDSSTTESA